MLEQCDDNCLLLFVSLVFLRIHDLHLISTCHSFYPILFVKESFFVYFCRARTVFTVMTKITYPTVRLTVGYMVTCWVCSLCNFGVDVRGAGSL